MGRSDRKENESLCVLQEVDMIHTVDTGRPCMAEVDTVMAAACMEATAGWAACTGGGMVDTVATEVSAWDATAACTAVKIIPKRRCSACMYESCLCKGVKSLPQGEEEVRASAGYGGRYGSMYGGMGGMMGPGMGMGPNGEGMSPWQRTLETFTRLSGKCQRELTWHLQRNATHVQRHLLFKDYAQVEPCASDCWCACMQASWT
jgi:hypothetical protein